MRKSSSERLKKFYKSKKGIALRKHYSEIFSGRTNKEHSIRMTGRKLSKIAKEKIGFAHRGVKTGIDTIEIVDRRLEEEMKKLSEQGFNCVPVGGKVRPDIVAFKNGKIYAIEVEYKKRPNYSKYDKLKIEYFDEVIWINRHKHPINK